MRSKLNICLIIFSILAVCFIEIFLFFIINLLVLGYKSISLLLFMLGHLLLLKHVSNNFMFVGGCNIYNIYMNFHLNNTFSKDLLSHSNTVIDKILELKTNNNQSNSFKCYYNTIMGYYKRIKEEKKVLDKINSFSIYGIKPTKFQHLMNYHIEKTIKAITNSNLLDDLINDSHFKKDSLIDKHIDYIIAEIDFIVNLLEVITKKESFKDLFNKITDKEKQIFNFSYLKAEQLLKYNCDSISINSENKKTNISALIIKSLKSEAESSMEDVLNTSSSDRSNLSSTATTASINTDSNNNYNENSTEEHDIDNYKSSNVVIDNMLDEAVNTRTSRNSNRSLFNKINSNKTLVIICSGNGGSYEMFHRNPFWINFYLDLKCDVLLWNYRGYGLSSGCASLKNIKLDADAVYNYCKNTLRYKKVIVHGISIGGIAASYIASKYTLESVILDRTFSNMSSVIETLLPKGKLLKAIYKFIFLFEKDSDNYSRFIISQSKCNKRILLSDRNDLIVKEEASITHKYTELEIQNIFGLQNNNLIKQLLQSDDKYNNIVNAFNILHESFYTVNNNNNSNNNEYKLNNSYLNLNESFINCMDGQLDMSSINDTNESEEFTLLQTVKDIINLNFTDVYTTLACPNYNINLINNYFKSIFIWGITNEKINPHPIIQGAKKFYNICVSLKRLNRNVESSHRYKELLGLLLLFFTTARDAYFQINIMNNINEIQEDMLNSLDLKKDVSNLGIYIQLKCGHNGVPNYLETKLLKNALNLSINTKD